MYTVCTPLCYCVSRVKLCTCVSYNMCNVVLCFALVCRITCAIAVYCMYTSLLWFCMLNFALVCRIACAMACYALRLCVLLWSRALNFALMCRITCAMALLVWRQWTLGAALDCPLSSSRDNLCTLEPLMRLRGNRVLLQYIQCRLCQVMLLWILIDRLQEVFVECLKLHKKLSVWGILDPTKS